MQRYACTLYKVSINKVVEDTPYPLPNNNTNSMINAKYAKKRDIFNWKALEKRDFQPESGNVDTYAILYSQNIFTM